MIDSTDNRYKVKHHKAKIDFSIIDKVRDLREIDLLSRRAIIEYIWMDYGIQLSINTLDDWLYYRTRAYR